MAIAEFGIETLFTQAEAPANDSAEVEGAAENTAVTLKLVK